MMIPMDARPTESNAKRQYIGLGMCDRRYALPIRMIREIIQSPTVTPLPGVDRSVRGVANLRGAIIPILSLRDLLRLPAIALEDQDRTIVLSSDSRTIGLTVDNVTDVLRIDDAEVQPPPETAVSADGYIAGLCRHDDQMVIVLDAEQLIQTAGLANTPS